MKTRPLLLALLPLLWLVPSPGRAAESPFAIQSFETEGRTTAAELVDLDGSGRADLLQVTFRGVPPDEEQAPDRLGKTEIRQTADEPGVIQDAVNLLRHEPVIYQKTFLPFLNQPTKLCDATKRCMHIVRCDSCKLP